MKRQPFHILASLAATALAVAGPGCCRKAPEPAPMSLDEAVELILAATTNQVALSGVEGDGGYDEAPARPAYTAEDARTNLVARYTLQLKRNAEEMAKATQRREAALEAAREANPDLGAAYAAMVVARKRYEELLKNDPGIQAAGEELTRLRATRGALLRQRAKFEGRAVSHGVSKKESK